MTARPEQLPPENTDWDTYLALSGRGWGKTRTAAEWLAWQATRQPKTRWAIVAPTFEDARDTCVEGESGILEILHQYGMIQTWNRTFGTIRLTNGSRIKIFSGNEPNRLRGPQHHGGWFDELAAFQYAQEAWDMYQFGARLGTHPQTIVTTTPKPVPIIRKLAKDETVIVVRGSTFDNAANLAANQLDKFRAKYEGTRLGRQELHGEILEDIEGALWNYSDIETNRITPEQTPTLIRVVVGVDPAVTSGDESDETGIIAAGVSADGHFYILDDQSLRATPDQWARVAVDTFRTHKADRIIAEVNNGGDMIVSLMRQVDSLIPVTKVTATRGKQVRAEPIAAMYEQGRVHHVGRYTTLEDQMISWTPLQPKSPDRIDALVWALTELSSGGLAMLSLAALAKFCPQCKLPVSRNLNTCPKCATPLG